MSKGPRPEPPFDELVARTDGLQPWRRVVHLAFGSGIAWIVYVLSPASSSTRWLFGASLAIVLVGDFVRLRSEAVNRLFFRAFSALVSPREAESMGLPWYMLGVFVVLWLAGGTFAVPSILVLAVADPAAGTVGRLWGKHPLGKGTWEGTSAFFLIAVAVLMPFVGIWIAVPVATLVAGVEILPTDLDDNLVIPITTAVGLWVMATVA